MRNWFQQKELECDGGLACNGPRQEEDCGELKGLRVPRGVEDDEDDEQE